MMKLKTRSFMQVLFLALLTLGLQSCSSLRGKLQKDSKKIGKNKSLMATHYDTFDTKRFPNDILVIANMIHVVQPEIEELERNIIATHISSAIKRYNIKPQIMVAIIDTESDFKTDKISSTGDLSLAQINVEVWNEEFIRLKKEPLDIAKIKTDQEYALNRMAEILSIIKKRYEKKDRKWYARYHSNTTHYKKEYLNKLDIRMKMLADSSSLRNVVAQND